MALDVKNLALGTDVAAASGNVLYELTAGKAAIVKNMRFVNTHASQTATLNVTLLVGSTEVQVSPKNVTLAPGAMYVDNEELTMKRAQTSETAKVKATASSGTVAFVLSGIERDA